MLCKIANPSVIARVSDYLKQHYPEILTGVGVGAAGGALLTALNSRSKKNWLRNILLGALVGGIGVPAGRAGWNALASKASTKPVETLPSKDSFPPFPGDPGFYFFDSRIFPDYSFWLPYPSINPYRSFWSGP